MPAATTEALAALGITETIIIGGEAVVSRAVEAQLPQPMRIAGPDRYATSVRIAEFAASVQVPVRQVILGQGRNPIDSLVAAQAGVPILFVDASGLSLEAEHWLKAQVKEAFIVGGAAAVPREVQAEVCYLTQ